MSFDFASDIKFSRSFSLTSNSFSILFLRFQVQIYPLFHQLDPTSIINEIADNKTELEVAGS